ncbi:MAG: hypothetical protein ACQEVA_17305 [Myxococcota bacterium]
MNRRFRMIHFVPEPFSGARIPIAALVEGDKGVEVAIASYVPSRACLGSRATETLLQGIVADLEAGGLEFGTLPVKFGPQVRLGEPKTLPTEDSDAVQWLRLHVLPRRSQAGSLRTNSGPEEGSRANSTGRIVSSLAIVKRLVLRCCSRVRTHYG